MSTALLGPPLPHTSPKTLEGDILLCPHFLFFALSFSPPFLPLPVAECYTGYPVFPPTECSHTTSFDLTLFFPFSLLFAVRPVEPAPRIFFRGAVIVPFCPFRPPSRKGRTTAISFRPFFPNRTTSLDGWYRPRSVWTMQISLCKPPKFNEITHHCSLSKVIPSLMPLLCGLFSPSRVSFSGLSLLRVKSIQSITSIRMPGPSYSFFSDSW